MSSSWRRRGSERSRMVTSAPRPTAILAACRPTTPPPMTATLAGSTPGTPPSRMPRPPLAFCSAVGTGLDRQTTGHFRHRRQQRQAAALVGHGFIGDGGDARFEQALGLFRIRSEMQIGIEDLAFAQLHPFRRLRLLDLDDHVGLFEDVAWRWLTIFGRRRRHRQWSSAPIPSPALGLDQNTSWPCATYSLHGTRRQADAIFMILDFLGAADAHEAFLSFPVPWAGTADMGPIRKFKHCQRKMSLRKWVAPDIRHFSKIIASGTSIFRRKPSMSALDTMDTCHSAGACSRPAG